jgi:hypothetical protein
LENSTVFAQDASPSVSSTTAVSDVSLLCPIMVAGNSKLSTVLVSSQLIITEFDNDNNIYFFDRRTVN